MDSHEPLVGPNGALERMNFFDPVHSRRFFIDPFLPLLKEQNLDNTWGAVNWDALYSTTDPDVVAERNRIVRLLKDTIETVLSGYLSGEIQTDKFVAYGASSGILPYSWQRVPVKVIRRVIPEFSENAISAIIIAILFVAMARLLALVRNVLDIEHVLSLRQFTFFQFSSIKVDILDYLFAALVVTVVFPNLFKRIQSDVESMEKNYHARILNNYVMGISGLEYIKNLDAFERDFRIVRRGRDKILMSEVRRTLLNIGHEKQRYLRFVQPGRHLVDANPKEATTVLITAMLSPAMAQNHGFFDQHVKRWKRRQAWSNAWWALTRWGLQGKRPANKWDILLEIVPLLSIQQMDPYRAEYVESQAKKNPPPARAENWRNPGNVCDRLSTKTSRLSSIRSSKTAS